jgi:hypothetical protein
LPSFLVGYFLPILLQKQKVFEEMQSKKKNAIKS